MKSILIHAASLSARVVVAAIPSIPFRELTTTPLPDIVYPELPRLVIYYQTTHDSNGRPISMLPLVTELGIALTHLIVCSIHVNHEGIIHLNDFPPHTPMFYTLWNETEVLRDAGVKIMGMVGGAAQGSFANTTLGGDDDAFEYYYGQLRDTIWQHELDGLDIDVEQPMSQVHINRLIKRLRYDFGPEFIITLAPVASALRGYYANLSGFSYITLKRELGPEISFYNAQFYNGFGSAHTTDDMDRFANLGWDLRKIVIGQPTTRENAYGFVSFETLNATLIALRDKYGRENIGGIMGWEYFNSAPMGIEAPWRWAQIMTAILRPKAQLKLHISANKAEELSEAWMESARSRAQELERLRTLQRLERCKQAQRRRSKEPLPKYGRPGTPNKQVPLLMSNIEQSTRPNVDYMAMVNTEEGQEELQQ